MKECLGRRLSSASCIAQFSRSNAQGVRLQRSFGGLEGNPARSSLRVRPSGRRFSQADKCTWWMPWHEPAMKDVASCEKPRGAASEH